MFHEKVGLIHPSYTSYRDREGARRHRRRLLVRGPCFMTCQTLNHLVLSSPLGRGFLTGTLKSPQDLAGEQQLKGHVADLCLHLRLLMDSKRLSPQPHPFPR